MDAVMTVYKLGLVTINFVFVLHFWKIND